MSDIQTSYFTKRRLTITEWPNLVGVYDYVLTDRSVEATTLERRKEDGVMSSDHYTETDEVP